MTETRDFDRLARAWLDLMPDEAPDRVIDSVLQAVDATPQRRSRIDTAVRRFFPMNRLTYAAVAVAIVVLGGGALLLTQLRQPNVGPSQAPTATPSPLSPPAQGAPLPAALQTNWFGGTRTLQGLEPNAGTVLKLGPETYKVDQSNQQGTTLLGGELTVSSGRLQVLRGAGPALACGTTAGSYAYALSPSGETLTISDPRDSCSIRQATLIGTWWRIDCKIGETTCLGLMDAGTYKSQYVRPVLNGLEWTPRFGGVTVTVPDGWANYADWPNLFGLNKAAIYEGAQDGSGAPSIEVDTQVVASAQGAARCTNTEAPGVARTADGVIRFLRGVPGITVGAANHLTIDGRPATWVDIAYDDATVKPCPDSGERLVQYLWSDHSCCAIAAGSVVRQIFIELDAADLLAITVTAPDRAQLQVFWTEAQPIIQTFHFE